MIATRATRVEVGFQHAAHRLLRMRQVGVGVRTERRAARVGRGQADEHSQRVVLPAPLGPRKPVTTPGSTMKLRLRTAGFR